MGFTRESERALSREQSVKGSVELKGMRRLPGRKAVGKVKVWRVHGAGGHGLAATLRGA